MFEDVLLTLVDCGVKVMSGEGGCGREMDDGRITYIEISRDRK